MSAEHDSARPPADGTDDYDDSAAVDDSSDVDDEFVEIQRTISQKRREDKESSIESPIQRLLPFPFSPNIRPLTISDSDSCVALENAAFPQKEYRASPEKFEYRLTRCPELCLGVFCTAVPEQARGIGLETFPMAKAVETDRSNNAVSVLLAHIVATRSGSQAVTDNDMDYPKDWKTATGKSAAVGHQESGRTVAIHSLAVTPKLHGCGLGKLILKSYIQQMNDSGTVDRVALICQSHLVKYYERFGFCCLGESKAQFGGGGWYDMVFDLAGPPKPPA